jgi:hypothetical protein
MSEQVSRVSWALGGAVFIIINLDSDSDGQTKVADPCDEHYSMGQDAAHTAAKGRAAEADQR